MLLVAWPPKPLMRGERKRENISFHVVYLGKSILFGRQPSGLWWKTWAKRGLLFTLMESCMDVIQFSSWPLDQNYCPSPISGMVFWNSSESAHRPPGLNSSLSILWKWVRAEGTIEENMSQICFLCNFCWNKRILEILRSPLLEIPNCELRTKETIFEVS